MPNEYLILIKHHQGFKLSVPTSVFKAGVIYIKKNILHCRFFYALTSLIDIMYSPVCWSCCLQYCSGLSLSEENNHPCRCHWALANLSLQECITLTPTREAQPMLCWPTAASLPHQNRPAFTLETHRYKDITRERLQEIAPLDQWRACRLLVALLYNLNLNLPNCQSAHTLAVMTETSAVMTWLEWHIVWTSFLQYQSWNDLLHWLNLLRSTVCQTIPYTSPWTRVRPTALAKIINASIEQTKWIHKSRQTVKLFKLSIYSREKEQHEGVFSSLSTFWCDSVSRVVSIFTLRPFQALCLFVLSENM